MANKNKRQSFAQTVATLKDQRYFNPSLSEVNKNPHTDYPLFGFKYLHDTTHRNCQDVTFFIKFMERLNKLSKLGWKEIEKSDRHSFGTENIPVKDIYPEIINIDDHLKRDKLTVFRATGDNHA